MQNEVAAKKKLSKRTLLCAVLVLACIPAIIYVNIVFWADRSYYLTATLIIALSVLPFALVFEGRRPKARELVIIAVLVGIAVAGRAAFFFLPQFKPIAAIVIIAGICFGAESGFMVGALSAFISNFMFGQGPWTPWQMFAYGIIGLLAGLLYKKDLLSIKRLPLCIFGALCALLIYGPLLDISSALMATPGISTGAILSYLLTGLPFNIVHAAATAFFLAVLAKPMIEKLERIKKKFGFLEP